MSPEPKKVCLVTGGAKRIGRAIVTSLARDFDVAIHTNNSVSDAETLAAELARQGATAAVFAADFSKPDEAGRLVEAVAARFGRLDLLVNSASRFEYDTPSEFTAAKMQELLAINLVAQLAAARAFGEVGSPSATLINMLDNKVFAPNPDFFSYSLAKFALKGATEMLAQHFRGRMRVCGIAPSNTLVSGDQTDATFAEGWARTLTGRGPTPADIADTVRFIWSTKSLNGEIIVLDGGQRLMSLERDVAFLSE
jgi:NAD(P)-dependent dehydrogenase (short-subunit alcohol dehydrogenase family)